MSSPQTYICQVETPEGTRNYVTVISPDTVFSDGLIPEAIVGVLKHSLKPGESVTPEIFTRNSVFNKFLHEVIAQHGPEQPGLCSEATRIGNGLVVIVDQRTPTPQGAIPPEDIIGAFEVQGGKIVSDSYRASPNHRLLSVNGFFRLDGSLTECLLRDLTARSANRSGRNR